MYAWDPWTRLNGPEYQQRLVHPTVKFYWAWANLNPQEFQLRVLKDVSTFRGKVIRQEHTDTSMLTRTTISAEHRLELGFKLNEIVWNIWVKPSFRDSE